MFQFHIFSGLAEKRNKFDKGWRGGTIGEEKDGRDGWMSGRNLKLDRRIIW